VLDGDVAGGPGAEEVIDRHALRRRLPEIAVPTLVVAGGHDWVCPPRASRTLAGGIPGARLAVLPEAGHFPFSEEPDQFHEAVGDFLAACTGSSADCHPPATPVANT
jgi:pimeloyl-ACP methyl ester carboxylesterase